MERAALGAPPSPAERLVFFSDAVVAIAITLLALELPVPEGRTDAEFLHRAAELRGDYAAFLISFAVVGTQWFVHNRLLAGVTSIGGRLPQWNLLWLLTIVATPFVTRVLTADGAFAARFATYAATQALSGMFLWLMLRSVVRADLLDPDRTMAAAQRRLVAMTVAFLISIPVALVTHWAYLCWIAVPLVARAGALADRLRAAPGPARWRRRSARWRGDATE
ncbi:DUF1211 domain-containing protein [Dactylosporangium vinaceum]|uniref:TMEM175 family protein n=1 Tax=Dactylosporangium vinaceum TaxID=53362 RepID=A0ABV5M9E5_9ACTN|nr:TMEM175 family protein [Dactylosporangium vinaceum]UAC00002.1 DUF1211 domain-containing protein [Dactylosporangium vinaceum]